MKLNNTIILTLDDFRRHFNINAFWISHRHFLRDMDKEKILVPEEEEDNLDGVRKWLEAEEDGSVTDEIRKKGIEHLSLLANHNVTVGDLRKAMGMLDYSLDIIVVSGDSQINLPGNVLNEDSIIEHINLTGKKERLHKIEIDGESNTVVTVLIGGTEVAHLKPQECLYATEIDGSFLRVLPNKLRRGPYILSLENIPGKFESTLLEEYYAMGCTEIKHNNVTQFTYDKHRKPIYSSGKYYTINDSI